MPDTHQDPSLKNQLRIMEDMYERIRLRSLQLTRERDDAVRDMNHLQAALTLARNDLAKAREDLKVTVRRT